MEAKKEFIKMMLKKYNKLQIKVIDKIDEQFAGSLCNGEIKIVFDIHRDFLIIEDVATIDNISLYYEFMSDEDIYKNSMLLDEILGDRIIKINNVIPILKNVDSNYITRINGADIKNTYFISQYIFGIKDTLKPIDEYIEQIKQSEAYKEYIAKKS